MHVEEQAAEKDENGEEKKRVECED